MLLTQAEIEEGKRCLIDTAAVAAHNFAGDSATPVPNNRCRPANQPPSDDTAAVWDELLGSDDDDTSIRTDPTFQRVELNCASAFVAYLEEAKTVPRHQDPLAWWAVNGHKYPSPKLLARKWLGCVATFSTAGNIVTAKRCQMDPELVRDIVFISENYAGRKNK